MANKGEKMKWITSTQFCLDYDYKIKTLGVAKCQKRLPEVMFKKSGHILYVDIDFVNKRLEARRRFWLLSHSLYYELVEIVGNTSALARYMAKLSGDEAANWVSWMTDTQWRLPDNSFVLKIPTKTYLFVRYGRWLLAIHRKYGLEFERKG